MTDKPPAKRTYKPRAAKRKLETANVEPPQTTLVPNPVIAQFVVHSTRSTFDVYIGRPSPRIPSRPEDCIWGNPFKMVTETDRRKVCEQYKDWLLKPEQAHLVEKAKDLKGKVLACWCSPKMCHGHIIAAIANGLSASEAYVSSTQ
eukprot:c2520_g1_i1.p1 GENE.c2520_g1_i1~~c2520_g1_i1.p1  ORF type:complete len:158 (+),score=30.56 c2520_g1_i1:37-474(+)